MNHEAKLISVIIPCYNAEKYISETIESVINQTHRNLEIIIIDDGSTDNSSAAIKALADKDSRIFYHFQQNKGMCAARNAGLRFAAGEYILFLDNDDVIEKSFLEDRCAFLTANPEYGLCGGEVVKIDERGRILPSDYTERAPTENMLDEILLYRKNVSSIPSNLLMRRSVLESSGVAFNESLNSTGDKYFLIQMARATKCSDAAASAVKYRIHGGSVSSRLSKTLLDDDELFFELLRKNDLIPKNIEKECLAKNYRILAGMSFKIGCYPKFVKYFVKLLLLNPKLIYNKNSN